MPAADVLYDLGTGLEVLSPLCPHLFLEMAGLGNFAKVCYKTLHIVTYNLCLVISSFVVHGSGWEKKEYHSLFWQGMAVVAARATRLPIYSSFAKEGNLSDLFAKGEAISTLFNVLGIGVGIQLASTVCSSIQGKVHD